MLKLSRVDVVVGSGIDIGVADWQQTGVQEYRIAYPKQVPMAILIRLLYQCHLGFFHSLSKHSYDLDEAFCIFRSRSRYRRPWSWCQQI